MTTATAFDQPLSDATSASTAQSMFSPAREEMTNCGDPWLAFDLFDPIGKPAPDPPRREGIGATGSQ